MFRKLFGIGRENAKPAVPQEVAHAGEENFSGEVINAASGDLQKALNNGAEILFKKYGFEKKDIIVFKYGEEEITGTVTDLYTSTPKDPNKETEYFMTIIEGANPKGGVTRFWHLSLKDVLENKYQIRKTGKI
jgi:hypothetical protein